MKLVAVIIPTYNRQEFLHQTLHTIRQQTMPMDCFEVIVVDDGSTDGTAEVAQKIYPFSLRYLYQENQGDAAARNTGVAQNEAEILVFLDDDILLHPNYLTGLVAAHEGATHKIVIGKQHLWLEEGSPLDSPVSVKVAVASDYNTLVQIPFVDVCSNNMSVRREAYYEIGMMQSLDFPGSSIWCDVDFAYRAYQKGFEFYCNPQAVCWHRDYVAQNLENHKSRMYKVAYRAVTLFQKYPDLPPHLPMFADKLPIQWQQDTLSLIVRKLVRRLASSAPALWGLEWLRGLLDRHTQTSTWHYVLERWIIGGHIYQGYQAGRRVYQEELGL